MSTKHGSGDSDARAWGVLLKGVDPGQGMPARVSQDSNQRVYDLPNTTEYQKQLFLNVARSVPVISPTSFQRVNVINFSLPTIADVLAITAPPEIRSFLAIRCSATSTVNLLIAFDNAASDSTASFALLPGGVLFLDSFVPQNDVHLAASAVGICIGVLTYANARFSSAPTSL
jgi:hypothetical protein